VTISIFHIGLPLDHPSIPESEAPKVAKRLGELQEQMRGAGYRYEFIYCSPESGLQDLKDQLRSQPCDGALVGGGIVGNPAMGSFLEEIVEAVGEVVPTAKVMLFDHSVDVRDMVEKCFKPLAD
jgi:hypothetical protein